MFDKLMGKWRGQSHNQQRPRTAPDDRSAYPNTPEMPRVRPEMANFDVVDGILVATALQNRLVGMDSADLVETILAEVDANGQVCNVIVDLENIEFMDSTSLGMLVFLNNRLQIIEGRLVIVNAAATLEQMFKITQLDRMLPVCRDVMKAVAILNRAQAA
ncbi:MAG: STAS domain-containing protein [Phycisphaerales bacterium JB058]